MSWESMRGAISASCAVAGRAALSIVQSSTIPCLQFRCMASRKLGRGCSHPINRNIRAKKLPLQAIAHPELRPPGLPRSSLSGPCGCAAIGFGATGPDIAGGTVKTEQSTVTIVSCVRYAPIYVTVGEPSRSCRADRCSSVSLPNGGAGAHSEISGVAMTGLSVLPDYSGDMSRVESQRAWTENGQALALAWVAVACGRVGKSTRKPALGKWASRVRFRSNACPPKQPESPRQDRLAPHAAGMKRRDVGAWWIVK